MIENIKIQHSIVYDFILSIARLADNEMGRFFFTGHDDLLERFRFDENITKWVTKTNEKMTDKQKKNIDIYFNSEYIFYKVFLYYIRYHDFHNIEEFIDFLKDVSPKELVEDHFTLFLAVREKLSKYLKKNKITTIYNNNDNIMKFIEHTKLSSNRKWDLANIYLNPQKAKDDIIGFLELYNKKIFSKEVDKIEKIIKKKEADLNRKLNQYGNEYLEILVNIDYKNFKSNKSIVLTVSYFSEIGYIIFYMGKGNEEFYVLGFRHMEIFVERKHGILSNVQIFKTLGDETRQNMIRLLSKKKWYGDELAKTMNLSNSTVSYHLNMLHLEGFVKLNRVEKRSYFTLNTKRLRDTILNALNVMIPEDKEVPENDK